MAERYIEPQKDARSYTCPHCNTINAHTDKITSTIAKNATTETQK